MTSGTRGKAVRIGGSAAAALALCLGGEPLAAAGTPAGTDVVNVATVTFSQGADRLNVRSNSLSLRVDEVIDVSVVPIGGPLATAPGARLRALPFRVTNTGNGREAFRLIGSTVVGGDDFDAALVRIAYDSNDDGRYDAAIDAAYVAGSEPVLAPGAGMTVFIVSDLPSNLADGATAIETLQAIALTGSGPAGTSFAGAGDGASDAVIGQSSAAASAQGVLVISGALPELVKTQVIAGPNGETAAVPGATITYTLTVRYSGTVPASDAVLRDPIPAGTAYVPGSLRLGGSALTDVAGDDAGEGSASGIAVRLGTLASSVAQTVTFQVRVNP